MTSLRESSFLLPEHVQGSAAAGEGTELQGVVNQGLLINVH